MSQAPFRSTPALHPKPCQCPSAIYQIAPVCSLSKPLIIHWYGGLRCGLAQATLKSSRRLLIEWSQVRVLLGEPTISITYFLCTPSILAELAKPYVQRMCTLARVATAEEPFHLLREAPWPCPTRLEPVPEAVSGESLCEPPRRRPHLARGCDALSTVVLSPVMSNG